MAIARRVLLHKGGFLVYDLEAQLYIDIYTYGACIRTLAATSGGQISNLRQ